MSDHKGRVRKLEQRFTEQAGARRLDECLDAFHRGDLATLEAQARLETEAGGRRGWIGNLFACILAPGEPAIAPEDLERPQ